MADVFWDLFAETGDIVYYILYKAEKRKEKRKEERDR